MNWNLVKKFRGGHYCAIKFPQKVSRWCLLLFLLASLHLPLGQNFLGIWIVLKFRAAALFERIVRKWDRGNPVYCWEETDQSTFSLIIYQISRPIMENGDSRKVGFESPFNTVQLPHAPNLCLYPSFLQVSDGLLLIVANSSRSPFTSLIVPMWNIILQNRKLRTIQIPEPDRTFCGDSNFSVSAGDWMFSVHPRSPMTSWWRITRNADLRVSVRYNKEPTLGISCGMICISLWELMRSLMEILRMDDRAARSRPPQ
jgi:hypothetical protein